MAKEKKSRGMSWEDASPKSSGAKNYADDIDIYRFTEEWTKLRLVGDVWEIKQHWLPTIKKTGGESAFPRLCLRTGDPNADCPYCKAGIRAATLYLSNAIIRDIQDSKPENKKKLGVIPKGQEFRNKDDDWWSPIKVVQFPATVADKIKGYKALNKSKDGTKYNVNHPKFGRDLLISKNTANAGAGMYDVQREDRTPLTEEESEYLLFDIDQVFDSVEGYKEALETLKGVADKGLFTDDNCSMKSLGKLVNLETDEEDEEELTPRNKKSKKSRDEDEDTDDEIDEDLDDDEPAPKKKSKKSRDEEEEEDDFDDDLDEEEEEEKPKKSSKKQDKKSNKKQEIEEEDDLDDEEEEEKPKSKKSKKSRDEEEDDLDDDLDDEEEEEKPKKQEKSKKRNRDEDEEDDLDEEEEEEEESQPKKSKKSNKKQEIEEEELDDDLDDDFDDEEEEEPQPKSKKSKKGRK